MHMIREIRKVCIIGGGTAGWWCASYLRKNHPDVKISLVESPNIPTIGVGESTMPHVKQFFKDLDISEDEWMPSCSAVKKKGNIKQNWNLNDKPCNFRFWYGDDIIDKIENDSPADDYAYHLDAAQAWKIVKKHTTDVEHLLIDATEETLPEADLYVDCTGLHRRFIKDKTFKTYPDTLVNACIVRRISEQAQDCTKTTARNYGWEFNVFLSDNRVGCGYVFNSNMISEEDAKKEYMKHNEGRNFLTDFRCIKWEPGCLKNPWSDNVVAIGLSSGFIDPMEANGLSLVVYQIRALSKFLKNPKGDKLYNRLSNKLWDQIADFTWHHYALSKRDDTEFWMHYKNLDATTTIKDRMTATTNYHNIYIPEVYRNLAYYFNVE